MPREESSKKTIDAPKNSHKTLKYIIYIMIVLIATGISLWLSLRGSSSIFDPASGKYVEKANVFIIADAFGASFQGNHFLFILIIIGMVTLSYLIDGFIIFVFCRLYTRKYKIHQGIATSLVGQFYSDVTPGASGGQVMETYTMKSQGIPVSNAASIMVMWFILYQTALLLFDVVAFIVESQNILALKSITIGDFEFPMVPLIIAGFLLNLSVIFLLFTMSFWHGFHNLILNHLINFLAKIKIVKKPEETRETLRAQVENFKIELKRLSANIPVVILVTLLFFLMLFCRFAIPYFAGLALNAWDGYTETVTGVAGETPFSFSMMMHSSFLGAFHQMVTGLLPLPGSAGVSELFYNLLFNRYFSSYNNVSLSNESQLEVIVSSTQILWRTVTFHLPLVVSGLTAAFYRSRPKEPIHYANRKTFIALTMSTLTERQATAETMYKTSQLSRKALQNRLNSIVGGARKQKSSNVSQNEEEREKLMKRARKEAIKEAKAKPPKPEKEKKKGKKKEEDESEWESWTV